MILNDIRLLYNVYVKKVPSKNQIFNILNYVNFSVIIQNILISILIIFNLTQNVFSML
jgi:hypothetical protein